MGWIRGVRRIATNISTNSFLRVAQRTNKSYEKGHSYSRTRVVYRNSVDQTIRNQSLVVSCLQGILIISSIGKEEVGTQELRIAGKCACRLLISESPF